MFDILSFYLCGTEEEVYVYICGVNLEQCTFASFQHIVYISEKVFLTVFFFLKSMLFCSLPRAQWC